MASDPLTEARFWAQVMTDAVRTVLCPPEWESRCKGYVDARGLGGLIKVVASPIVPPNQIVVVDENALEAANRQAIQTWKPVWPDTPSVWRHRQRLVDPFGDLERVRYRLARLAAAEDEEMARAVARWEDDGGVC